jgi:hypothetical protein
MWIGVYLIVTPRKNPHFFFFFQILLDIQAAIVYTMGTLTLFSGCSKMVNAPALGAGWCQFDSDHSDQINKEKV